MTKSIIRNEKYLKFIRTMPCVLKCNGEETHAHHWRKGQDGGIGLKPSDTRCIPLCYDRHSELHQIGEVSFAMKYGIDPNEEMAKNLQSYLERLLNDFDATDRVRILEMLIEFAEEEVTNL